MYCGKSLSMEISEFEAEKSDILFGTSPEGASRAKVEFSKY